MRVCVCICCKSNGNSMRNDRQWNRKRAIVEQNVLIFFYLRKFHHQMPIRIGSRRFSLFPSVSSSRLLSVLFHFVAVFLFVFAIYKCLCCTILYECICSKVTFTLSTHWIVCMPRNVTYIISRYIDTCICSVTIILHDCNAAFAMRIGVLDLASQQQHSRNNNDDDDDV